MKQYRIGRLPHYREGVYYGEGDIIEIPAKEEPGPGWEEITDGAERKTAKEPKAQPKTMADARASDRKI